MTAIVGLVHNAAVYIGGDSSGSSNYVVRRRANPKVFRNGSYVLGYTTSFRMGQLLQYSFDPPDPVGDIYRLMVTDFIDSLFIDSLRECLNKGGWATKNSEREEGGQFLVGIRDRLFTISREYQVCEDLDGYATIGDGEELTLGALYATSGMEMEPLKRITLALEAAERYCKSVRAPFTCISTEAEIDPVEID